MVSVITTPEPKQRLQALRELDRNRRAAMLALGPCLTMSARRLPGHDVLELFTLRCHRVSPEGFS